MNLLTSQVLPCLLKVVNLDTCLLFGFFAFFDILLEVVFLGLQLQLELMDTLTAVLSLLIHTLLFFDTRCKFSEPQILGLSKELCEGTNLVIGTIVGGVTELASKFSLHCVVAEMVDELQDIGLDLLSVLFCHSLSVSIFKAIAFQVFHVKPIDLQVHILELLLTLSLRVEKSTDWFAEGSN